MFLKLIRTLIAIGIFGAIAVFLMRFAFPLPTDVERTASAAIALSEDTFLGAAVAEAQRAHPGLSGVAPLVDGRDALAARVLLARAAEASIDVQYYIWQRDTTSWILLDELRQAADRGVRVRLLLDDNGIPGLDRELAAFDALPNAEVRLFNPFTLRRPKLASYAFDFPRLNRRMHNKSFTVDGAVTIVGGRNVGDIYFAYGDGTKYFDLDVLAAGPAASDVSQVFDQYWNSAPVYPADAVLPPAPEALADLVAAGEAARASATGLPYIQAIGASRVVADLRDNPGGLEWTVTQLVTDDPEKGLGRLEEERLLIGRLTALLQEPERSLDLVSAYFIPGSRGTDVLTGLAEQGVAVRVVTNSLESTDVAPVHSAYMRYRRALLEAGVEVQEIRARPDAEYDSLIETMLAGSAGSLHAKTFAVDDELIFIGSFNFDPRSAQLNTEMGFLIESPAMARGMRISLDNPVTTYVVREAEDGGLQWVETEADGSERIHEAEPNTSGFERTIVWLMGFLPVEWML